jgi:transcriptional regulator with XRE-family HTH domain
MDLAAWLKKSREQRGMSMRDLAQQSGVKHTTISRIENGFSDVTLQTIISIFDALGLTVEDLALSFAQTHTESNLSYVSHVLSKTPAQGHRELLYGSSLIESNVLNSSRVASILVRYRANSKSVCELLAVWLNEIEAAASLMIETLLHGSKRGIEPNNLGLTGLDVERFLDDWSAFRFEFEYPRTVTADLLSQTCRQGGVLISQDIPAFIRRLRGRDFSPADVAQTLRLSPGSLHGLVNGGTSKTKVTDVIGLERMLNTDGDIIRMFWSVRRFEDKFGTLNGPAAEDRDPFKRDKREVRLAVILVKVYRWYQVLKRDKEWLANSTLEFSS